MPLFIGPYSLKRLQQAIAINGKGIVVQCCHLYIIFYCITLYVK